jgi:hypothetical protein
MQMKQTAVEWLYSFMLKPLSEWPDDMWDQAKEMEKEQIKDAHIDGLRLFDDYPHAEWAKAEHYYNETYNKQ